MCQECVQYKRLRDAVGWCAPSCAVIPTMLVYAQRSFHFNLIFSERQNIVCIISWSFLNERVSKSNLLCVLYLFRVLQNSRGPVVPSQPDGSRAPLLSPKAASEVPKRSTDPRSRLAAPPVPTLGRGFSEGDDILLDISPPSSKHLSAAKVFEERSS